MGSTSPADGGRTVSDRCRRFWKLEREGIDSPELQRSEALPTLSLFSQAQDSEPLWFSAKESVVVCYSIKRKLT